MNFVTSKQIENFDAKDSFVMVVFLYAQNFMNKFSLKLVVFSFFTITMYYQHCCKLKIYFNW